MINAGDKCFHAVGPTSGQHRLQWPHLLTTATLPVEHLREPPGNPPWSPRQVGLQAHPSEVEPGVDQLKDITGL